MSLVGMTHPWGRPLLVLAGYITQANVALLHALDFGYLYPLVRPRFSEIVLYYGLVMALLYVDRKQVAALLFCVLIPLCAVQVYADYRERFNTGLRIHFIDVGAGDAALIEAPGGLRILIDGGGYPGSDFDMGRQVIAPFLLYRKVRTIDYVINTHPHADHIGGLSYVLRHFKVSHLVTAGFFPKERLFLELVGIARARGVPHLIWKKGDGIETGAFRIDTLYPADALPSDNLNDTSLVFKVRHGETTFLLPADITSGVEEQLVLSGVAPQIGRAQAPPSRKRVVEQLRLHLRRAAEVGGFERRGRVHQEPPEPGGAPAVQGALDTRPPDRYAGAYRSPVGRQRDHVEDVRKPVKAARPGRSFLRRPSACSPVSSLSSGPLSWAAYPGGPLLRGFCLFP